MIENTKYGKYIPQAVLISGQTVLGFAPDTEDMTRALLILKVRTVLWNAYWKGQQEYQKICKQANAEACVCRTVITSDDLLLRVENIFATDGDPYVKLPSLNNAEETWYLYGGGREALERALQTASARKIFLESGTFESYAMTAVDERFRETGQMRNLVKSALSELRLHAAGPDKSPGRVIRNGTRTELPASGQKVRSALLESFRNETEKSEETQPARTFRALPLAIGAGSGIVDLNGCELYQLPNGKSAVLIPKADIDKSGIIHTIQVLPQKEYFTFHMDRREGYAEERPMLISGAELIRELEQPDLRERNKELLGRQLKLSNPNEQEAVYESGAGVFRLTRDPGRIRVETFNDEYESAGNRIHTFRRDEYIPTFEEFLKQTGYGKGGLKRISQAELENRHKQAHKRRPFWQRRKK